GGPEKCVGGNQTFFEGAESHDGFEGRAWRESLRKRLFLVDSREDAAGGRIHHQDGAVPPPKACEGGGADHRVLAGGIIVRGGVAERTHPPGTILPSTAPPARTGGAHLRLPMRP